jgi:DNA-binding transcriptional ArsR family regulator
MIHTSSPTTFKLCGCDTCHIGGKELKCQLLKLKNELKIISIMTRLEVMLILKDKPHCVHDLTVHTLMSQSLVSHHLKDIMDVNLVNCVKKGKFTEYYLTKKGRSMIQAIELLL